MRTGLRGVQRSKEEDIGRGLLHPGMIRCAWEGEGTSDRGCVCGNDRSCAKV